MLLLGQIAVFLPASSTQPKWPAVKAFRKRFFFPETKKARLNLIIRGADGQKLYRLHCNGASTLESEDADAWADFSCHLHSLYSKDHVESLLIETQSGFEAQSRGEFWSGELIGQCAEYPEWGRVRNFGLRGMRLTVEISDMHFAPDPRDPMHRTGNLLRSFRFEVSVLLDPLAVTETAEPTGIKFPWKDVSTNCQEPKS